MTSRTNFRSTITHDPIPDKCRNPTRKLKDGTIVALMSLVIYCSNCGSRKRINPSCGKRNCPRCQHKRSIKLEKKYLEPILKTPNKRGHMWTFVNLTGVRIVVSRDTLASDLRRFGNVMQKFLSKEYPEGGLATMEHTIKYSTDRVTDIESAGDFIVQWGSYVNNVAFVGPATIIAHSVEIYLHAHALCYGGFKDKISLEKRWAAALIKAGFLTSEIAELNDGRRFIGIELVRNPKQAARYILKYVAKGVNLPDEYLEGLKRLKYVRSWGFLYGLQEPTFDMLCQDCGGKCYVTLDEGQLIEYFGDNPDPLKIERVPRLETGPPKKEEVG